MIAKNRISNFGRDLASLGMEKIYECGENIWGNQHGKFNLLASVGGDWRPEAGERLLDLDWYYLMDYDLEYNSSAPYSDTLMYLNNWTNYGVPKSQLVVGVPFFGSAGASWSNSTALSYSTILADYASLHGGALPATRSSVCP